MRTAGRWLILGVLLSGGCDGAGGARHDAGARADAAPSGDAGSIEDAATSREPSLEIVDVEGRPVDRLRYGEPFAVRVVDLWPSAEVTIESAFPGYEGQATFVAGESGVVDTSVDAPIAGSYEGVEPEGLLWSMTRVSNARAETLDIELSATVGDVRIERTFSRAWLNEGLTSQPVTERGLVAEVFAPVDASEPLPGILVVGGSEGGIETASFQAAWLAGYGYVAMALAYFGMPGLPADLADIPIEYFGDALEALASREDVDGTRIGVIGTSRGGELVLMLGEHYSTVRAVVAQVPSGVRWGAVGDADRAAWTYEGTALPDIPSVDLPPRAETLPGGGTGYRFTPVFDAAVDGATPMALEAATIAVERTEGAVLLLGGGDDGLWPSCRLAQIAMDRLVDSGHTTEHDDALHCFEDAGHFFPAPGWPTAELYALDRGTFTMVMGGTPRGNAHAQREGLTLVREFLASQLGAAPSP